jgi:4-amino-4-deoxy-L-arabinose transferase-like glycosyltransferase
VLSAFQALSSPAGWAAGAILAVLAALGGIRATQPRGVVFQRPQFRNALAGAVRSQPVLAVLFAGVMAVAAAGIVTLLVAAPSNWDSLAYQLARVGYYLQQGSLADFGANFFSQEQHARGTSILQCAIITLSGKSDVLVGLPQMLAYGVCLTAVYGLARQSGCRPPAALAGAAVFGLLTIVAMEAPTPQNDLVLASFIGCGLVGTIEYFSQGRRGALLLAALGFALALAVKASALTCVPACALVLAVAARRASASGVAVGPRLARAIAAIVLAILLFAWPAGYWKNWRRFGNPLGGPEMMQHHVETRNGVGRGRMGVLNLIRYTGDLCTLDGLPETWGGAAGSTIKHKIGGALAALGLVTEPPTTSAVSFSWSHPRFADENLSFFGWLGPALLIPGCLGALIGWRRKKWPAALALGAGIFIVGQAFAGPYDPWRGRHFIYGAILAAPAAAWLFETPHRWLRRWAWCAAVAGAVAVVPALLWRLPNPLFSTPIAPSIFQLDRLEQMAIHHPSYPALAAFDRLVPPSATVIVALSDNEYEYALFGEKFSRRLIPWHQARQHPERMDQAGWLLIDTRRGLASRPADIPLGYHWSLRRLGPLRPGDFDFIQGLYPVENDFAWMAATLVLRVTVPHAAFVNLDLGDRLPQLPEADELEIVVDGNKQPVSFRHGRIALSIPLSAGRQHEIAIVSPQGARSPRQLGLSQDDRQLSYRVRQLQVSDRARFPAAAGANAAGHP